MDEHRDLSAIILDFDGTIADLNIDFTKLRSSLKDFFILNYNLVSDFFPLLGEVDRLANKTPRPQEAKEKALQIIDDYEIRAAKEAIPASGVSALLNYCKENQIKVAVATRNGRDCVRIFFDKNKLPRFDFLVARGDVKNLKPHPEQAQVIIDELKVGPDKCLIIGDTFHDFELGRNASIPTIIINKYLTMEAISCLLTKSGCWPTK